MCTFERQHGGLCVAKLKLKRPAPTWSARMSSVSSAASTPLSPSFLQPRYEGSGLGAVGGWQKGDNAQRVRFAYAVLVVEGDDGIIEAEDVQAQQTANAITSTMGGD